MNTKTKSKTHAVVSDDLKKSLRTTSGYVPIVGTDPGNPDTNITAPADGTSTTESAVTAVESTSAALAAGSGKKLKCKGYSISVTSVEQQYYDTNLAKWVIIPSTEPNPPFSTDVVVTTSPISVGKDEQFGMTVTNQPYYKQYKARLVVGYTMSVNSQNFVATYTVNRPPF